MFVTSIEIHPQGDGAAQVRATADIILNDSLALKGIKVMRGRYGYFLAFPTATRPSPKGEPPATSGKPSRPVFETVSLRFRKELQDRILKAYQDYISRPVSLFG